MFVRSIRALTPETNTDRQKEKRHCPVHHKTRIQQGGTNLHLRVEMDTWSKGARNCGKEVGDVIINCTKIDNLNQGWLFSSMHASFSVSLLFFVVASHTVVWLLSSDSQSS